MSTPTPPTAPTAFRAIDFYEQALKWFNSGGSEASDRSVASRAYYAAFLHARAIAGVNKYSKETHKETADYYLAQSGRVNLEIGNDLYSLHKLRKEADYDVVPTFEGKLAKRALNLSKKILTRLEMTPSA